MSIHFFDSASPQNIASGVHAAVYINGFAWPKSDIERMEAIFCVSVERAASWAQKARCLDIENGAGLPEDLVPFIKERRRLGHDDATGYVNRSNWKTAAQDVKDNHLEMPLWWVSTLDGTQEVEEHLDDGTELHAWAVQYQGGLHAAFDLSVLHGVNNFHRP